MTGYMIRWRSILTGKEGHREQPLSLFVAEAAAAEMNAMYLEIHHWVELHEEDIDDNNE